MKFLRGCNKLNKMLQLLQLCFHHPRSPSATSEVSFLKMIKVPSVVQELLQNDEVALEALLAGLLNFSAYADVIHKKVEKLTFKPVKRGTIVVSLTRLAKKGKLQPQLRPDVKITNIRLTSSLAGLSFKKTADLQRNLAVIHPFNISVNDLFAVTQGVGEITIICSEESKQELLKHIKAPIKSQLHNLAAITVQIPKEYIHIPNVYHVLISSLASKRINIVELVSTFTEISFVVNKEDMETAFKMLNMYFTKEK